MGPSGQGVFLQDETGALFVPIALSLLLQSFGNFGGTGHGEDVGGAFTKIGSVMGRNSNAAIRYLILSKTPDARTDNAALSLIFAPATIVTLDLTYFGSRGWSFGAHLSYAWSTSPAGSYNAATAADHDLVIMGAP